MVFPKSVFVVPKPELDHSNIKFRHKQKIKICKVLTWFWLANMDNANIIFGDGAGKTKRKSSEASLVTEATVYTGSGFPVVRFPNKRPHSKGAAKLCAFLHNV